MFISLLAQTMVAEELCELAASPHEQLLSAIEQAGSVAESHTAIVLLEPRIGKVRPRGKIWFPWRTQRMQLWRLRPLQHPLWLGEDGVVYRAYERGGNSSILSEPCDYWLRAELELRDVHGLQRVLDALMTLIPPDAQARLRTYLPTSAEK